MGVALGIVAVIVFVQTDFVVVVGMLAQIHHGIQSDAAHSGLEVAGFIFVGNNADASVLGIGGMVFKGYVYTVFFNQKRLKAKIGF